jgi:hypothetical protein
MRFSRDKVFSIAEKIVAMLDADPDATLLTTDQEVVNAVAGAIFGDLEEEDDIDAEVERMLEEHQLQIDRENMDAELIRRKFKDQIARKRGFKI